MPRRRPNWSRRLLLAVLLLAAAGVWWQWRGFQRAHRYDKAILAAARKYGVDPAIIKAVMWQESRFDAAAVGRVGEIGLMQITEPTALEWAGDTGVTNFAHQMLFDPALNTSCGTWYLAKLLRRYPRADDPLPYALADYNAGRMHVLRWAKDSAATNSADFLAAMTFPGTRKYIEAVMARRPQYTDDFPTAP
jgi:soluble lytic murein transglycosylase